MRRAARLAATCLTGAGAGLASLAPAAARAQPAAPAPVRPSAAEPSYPARCGVGSPLADSSRYVPLPRGDVFCPLVADPKAIRSFVSYQRASGDGFARNVAAVGVADQFAFFRFAGARPGDGVQLGISAAVFAQFDLDGASFDLLNADYLVGLPLTFRRGGFSGRARVYHQSSHLGDELLLRPDRPDRENLSFESAELLVSQDVGAVRGYAGGEVFLRRDPADLPRGLVHAGVELRPERARQFGALARARLVAGADLKVVRDSVWRPGVNVRAGVEVGRPREGPVPGRRWSLLGEFYDGPSPYGQFQRDQVRLAGVGFHFTL